jgi:hypothetical protein
MFQRLKEILGNTVRLAHPKDDQELCLCTDASDSHWGLIATQIPPEDLEKQPHHQKHQPLSFLRGSFQGSQKRWSVIEMEAYPIIAARTS